ncbi:PD-(D/E)XK nuclease family protein [Vibrio splendidus]
MIDKLLNEISLINLKYEKLQEVTESDFNIFSILRNESDEVALHSRFIGELLNPEGSHNQGEVFQQILLQQLQDENLRYS